MTKAVGLRGGLAVALFLSLLVPPAAFRARAESEAIQLAVDTANFNQDGLLVLFGSTRRQGEIGLPVAAGDITGDGRADVLFGGMYGSSDPFTNNGTVNIYLSDGRDSGFINQADHPANLFRILGSGSGDLLGTSSSINGDVNHDGLRDILTCAALQDGPNGFNAGAAYVVYGKSSFSGDINLASSPSGVTAIYGPQANGRMGIWCDEGDVDGDGFADIVIGSDQINTATGQHVGGAYIVFGAANLPAEINLASPPAGVRTARIVGAHEEDHWGAALQVGDINNDGIGDIIIGASIDRDSGSYVTVQDQVSGHNFFAADVGGSRPQAGEVYVIYGQRTWPTNIDLGTPPANATHVLGAHANDFLGSQVHFGDLNGDGRTDLVLGALLALAPDDRGQTGAVYVIYGSASLPGATIDLLNPDASGQRVTTVYGVHALDCAGDSVRSFDINKDGLSDLFIGSPERTFELNGEDRDDAGMTEIIFGRRDFLPSVIKLYDPPAGIAIYQLAGAHGDDQGLEGGDEFSYRLTGGDVDGDGYVDYIANAMHGDGLNNSVLNAGNVYIFSGKKLSARLGQLVQEPSPTPQLSGAALSLNGQPVQQANAGQTGLRITISGTNLRSDTEIMINGTVVASHLQAGTPAQITVELDENPSIRNSAGQLVVSARNTTPPASGASNQVVAGTLVGPHIDSVKLKKKGSGTLLLKIFGSNFPANVTVEVRGDNFATNIAVFGETDFISLKIPAAVAPSSGTVLRIIVRTPAGITSNEVTKTVP
ncbi:MAG TPA: IPT/TIG domain-containing protein [Blastocatellia bacterium]|nr:IPT/TIG domain-containing protein [Blastocatellia bacterium]